MDEPVQRIKVSPYEPTMDTRRAAIFDTKMAPHEASGYKPGGYRPTHLNEHLNRYRIVHKLGHGDEATVWLAAVEPEIENCTMRYVALKIFRADLSGNNNGEINNELSILRYLDQPWVCDYKDHEGVVMKHPGENRVTRIFTDFTTASANGTHLVLVLPFRGFCLRDIKGLQQEKKQSINKQLAWGVSYLHRRGVVHGDLTATNVVLGMDRLHHCDTANLYVHVGEPEKISFGVAMTQGQNNRLAIEGASGSNDNAGDEPSGSQNNVGEGASGSHSNMNGGVDGNSRNDSTPDYIVTAIDASKLKHILFGDSITIIDFGRAFKFGTGIQSIPRPEIPIFYPAPESVFNYDITEKLDIWHLACLMWEVRTEEVLFQGPHFGGFKKGRDEEDAIIQWGDVLDMPAESYRFGHNLTRELKKQHTLNDGVGAPSMRLRMLFYRCNCVIGPPEMESFHELLAGMLRYNPKRRFTAEDVICDYYCTTWVKN